MNEMIEYIHKGQQPMDVIKTFFENHLRIVFDGDGYSKDWEVEAMRRGLPNRKNTVEAIEHFIDEKNMEMLSTLGIFTKEELYSRYEVLLDSYIKTIHMEALTSLKMVKNEIYPAVMKYIQTLATTSNQSINKYWD